MKSDSKKFIFIHIPKTAGNAVQKVLMPYSSERVYRKSYKGNTLNDFEIETLLGKGRKHEWVGAFIENPHILEGPLENYYKFSVVRNPWERMVSFYCYTFPSMSQKVDPKHFLSHGLSKNMPSMLDYISYDKEIQMDKIIRYENLEVEFSEACSHLSIPFKALELTNVSKHPHYSYFYNQESLDLIEKIYKNDIDSFGYSFDSEP